MLLVCLKVKKCSIIGHTRIFVGLWSIFSEMGFFTGAILLLFKSLLLSSIAMAYLSVSNSDLNPTNSYSFFFYFGSCLIHEDDVLTFGVSFSRCRDKCKSRLACDAVSYKREVSECREHFYAEALTPVTCIGYVFSRKNSWSTVRGKFCFFPFQETPLFS